MKRFQSWKYLWAAGLIVAAGAGLFAVVRSTKHATSGASFSAVNATSSPAGETAAPGAADAKAEGSDGAQSSSPQARDPGSVRIPDSWPAFLEEVDPSFVPAGMRTVREGEALAARHCSACHSLPAPSILPKRSWLEVGAQTYRILHFLGNISDDIMSVTCAPQVTLAMPAPSQKGAWLSKSDFAKIIYYYFETAPVDPLPQTQKPVISPVPTPLSVRAFKRFAPPYPVILFAAIDEQAKRIVTIGIDSKLDVFDAKAEYLRSLPLTDVPTGISSQPDGWYITLRGRSFIDPSAVDGKVVRIPSDAFANPMQAAETTIVSGLRRPLGIRFADFSGDGFSDMLIAETGAREGSFSLRPGSGSGEFGRATSVFDGSGTEWASVVDANDDGHPDVFALIGLAEQAGYLFVNDGTGKFQRSEIVRQFPGFGYSHAFIADVNGDGRKDIVTANGKRLTLLTFPEKNYHGVRVLSSAPGGTYKERFFYPMHGASQSVAHDFDGDGDADIVAVAFSPAFGVTPLESIVYLENRGEFNFVPHRIPEAEGGRWSSVAMGDLDGDGHVELVLAAAYPKPYDEQTQGLFGDGPRIGLMVLGRKR